MKRTARLCVPNGFSLVELAIVIVIMGLFMATSVNFYSVWKLKFETRTIKAQIEGIADAIYVYMDQRGHLPCPASFASRFGDKEFGAPTDCKSEDVPPGSCRADGGYCVQAGRILEAQDENGPGKGKAMRVRIGAVPFRALNIPFESMKDLQGSYITYAVTELLAASSADYEHNDGAIDVVDSGKFSVLTPPKTASFALISHGADRSGARAFDSGRIAVDCPYAMTADGENCDYTPSSRGAVRDAVFKVSFFAPTGGKSHFDDIVLYRSKMSRLAGGIISCADRPVCSAENVSTAPICKIRGGNNNMPLCVQREDLKGGVDPDMPYEHNISTWKDACDWAANWRKPTIEELRVLFANGKDIGGFEERAVYLSRTSYNPEVLGNDDRKMTIWTKIYTESESDRKERSLNIAPKEGDGSGRIRCVHY